MTTSSTSPTPILFLHGFTLDASHSPFLSMPGQVADIVLKLIH
jgi:hypothetical protein